MMNVIVAILLFLPFWQMARIAWTCWRGAPIDIPAWLTTFGYTFGAMCIAAASAYLLFGWIGFAVVGGIVVLTIVGGIVLELFLRWRHSRQP